MKKFLNICMCALICALSFTVTSCHRITPGAGEEAVLVAKPMFFGHGGVDMEPVKTGSIWAWWTTEGQIVNVWPQQFNETLDDAASNDNTLLDFKTSIKLKVKDGHSAILISNYGPDWYKRVIRDMYVNTVRNYVSRFNPFDLMSNREVCDSINLMTQKDIEKYIATLSKDKELPIEVIQVIVGRAIPNKLQKEEMERTAAATQAKQTQERRLDMEKSRELAEKQRAISDKAYQHELGLSAEQFIRLKAWDIIANKKGANIDVLFDGGANPMWNIRR